MICREDRLGLMPSPNIAFAPHIVPRPSQTWRHPGEQSVRPHTLAQILYFQENSGCRVENKFGGEGADGGECDHRGGVGCSSTAAACSRWTCCACHEGHRVTFSNACSMHITPQNQSIIRAQSFHSLCVFFLTAFTWRILAGIGALK